MSEDSYEAMVFTANLPKRVIAFIMPESGVPFAGGIYRITRVRSVTPEDERAFPTPPDEICPMCDRPEDWV